MIGARNGLFPVAAGLLAVALAGCSRSDYAPVSGVITMNGKPYRNGIVLFLPEATKGNTTPGRGATGHTDENGRYSLKTVNGISGAAVGKNAVQIRTKYSAELKGFEFWDPTTNKAVRSEADPVPPEWNTNSTREFDVPPGGTDKANFDIVTAKSPKRK